MASSPDTTRQHQAEAAALALLLAVPQSGVVYSLPQLVKQAGIRRTRPFRKIQPTSALKSDMSAPYYAIGNGWSAEVDALMRAYETGDVGAIQRQTGLSAVRIDQIVAAAKRQFPQIASRIASWHARQFVSRVRAATSLDVSMLTRPQDTQADVDATVAWNGQLAEDVHAQAKNRVVTALVAGAAAALPADQVKAQVKAAIAKAKKRGAAIGDDQTDKLSRAMDRSRRKAAGVTQFMWLHSAHVVHPRPHHVARNGKIFSEDDIAPDDRAGVPFGCQCREIPVLQ